MDEWKMWIFVVQRKKIEIERIKILLALGWMEFAACVA